MSYIITAANHGLNQIPCDVNAGLFGEFAHNDSNRDSEQSREFNTLTEAQSALVQLEASGDWPDGAPDYEIEEVA